MPCGIFMTASPREKRRALPHQRNQLGDCHVAALWAAPRNDSLLFNSSINRNLTYIAFPSRISFASGVRTLPGVGCSPLWRICLASWAVIRWRLAPSVNTTPQLFSSRRALARDADNARFFGTCGRPGSYRITCFPSARADSTRSATHMLQHHQLTLYIIIFQRIMKSLRIWTISI